jgi:proteasome lid subunit RPN8/RPN11
MADLYAITQRHYNIIIKQGIDNLPQEAGGFFGGKEGVIQAILPMGNQFLYDRTGTFAVSSEDIGRAHDFFAKHGLEYYGMYHTHPKGAPSPSKADIQTRNRYHIIIALSNPQQPIVAAFEVQGNHAHPLSLKILQESQYRAIDIHAPKEKDQDKEKTANLEKGKGLHKEAEELGQLIQNIKENKSQYKKEDPHQHSDSSFSTSA